jgi:glycosyltransferase involved in cell wall biosynthesis
MRALVITDPQIPVPPTAYGGTERIVALLCDGLKRRGWTVDLLAGAGSRRYGGRLYTHQAPTLAKPSRVYRKIWFQALSLWAARSADVVVSFGRADYLWALLRTRVPLVLGFQNPILTREVAEPVALRGGRGVRFVGISQAQITGLPHAELTEVVYNATDTDRFPFSPVPGDPPYVMFLGRLTANKGVHLAIEAARAAGVRLVLAGNVSNEPGGPEYFAARVKPNLGPGVEWIGPVADDRKRDLLGGATALLFPAQWPEPFGIVMAEALACGCPVIGWRNGSVPEVVRDSETGFVVDSVAGMVDAIRRAGRIDRAACRRDAEERFSADALVGGYLRVIDQVVAGR